jgi:V/A-type H+-transporting ATPase subunit C
MVGGSVSGYSAVHARVRAMYSTMLPPEVWTELCEAVDFTILVGVLKETVYGPYLADVEDKDLTPRRAVYQLNGHLADAFVTVIRLAPSHARHLLSQCYRLFEVDNLKAILRGVMTGAAWDQIRYTLFPLGSFTILPAQAMVEAGSIKEAIERLHGTPYYDTLAHAMERYTAEQSLFPLEVALDLDYWREMWRDVNRLPTADRAQGLRVVGSLVDLNNLMWAIRYRVYHHLSEEEIINYTLPFGYRVQDEDLCAIAGGADITQVLVGIYPDLADVDALLQEPRSGLPRLELRLQRHLVEEYHAASIGYPFHVGILLAYLLLNKLEIQDLTVLIEAKSLQMSADRFQRHLLIGCEGSSR